MDNWLSSGRNLSQHQGQHEMNLGQNLKSCINAVTARRNDTEEHQAIMTINNWFFGGRGREAFTQ